ncbi:MAG: hypothetical protein M3N31_08600, partial [Actinomycetota bacterium]|nr:hypothetical protein [Actinomycetota bacterium]
MVVGDGWDFAIRFPEGWIVREPDLALRPEATAQAVDVEIADNPAMAPFRDHMIRELLAFADEADSQSAIIAARLWQMAGDVTVLADLMVFEGIREAPDSAENELVALVRTLSRPKPGVIGEPDVQVVELPAVRAVRVRTLAETEPDEDGSTLVLDTVQYWV